MDVGIDDYLTKPVNFHDLVLTLLKYLDPIDARKQNLSEDDSQLSVEKKRQVVEEIQVLAKIPIYHGAKILEKLDELQSLCAGYTHPFDPLFADIEQATLSANPDLLAGCISNFLSEYTLPDSEAST